MVDLGIILLLLLFRKITFQITMTHYISLLQEKENSYNGLAGIFNKELEKRRQAIAGLQDEEEVVFDDFDWS
tara:strand:- start:555 stop:770 length:216 start_codon:yes stop_codon:yes gene_type:complete